MSRASGDEPPELIVGWASHAAAKHACEKWHYAGVLPTGKLVKVGAWEDGELLGVVLFSRGASPWLGNRWDLDHIELCELTRVALREHRAPVTAIVSRALRLLRERNPGLRLVVSFADPSQKHLGVIYQAGNWIYTGRSNDVVEHFVRGRWRHMRGSYHDAKANPETPARTMPGKHRYLYPLDRAMRRLAERHRQPYPKRAATPEEGPEASSLGGRFDPDLAASPLD